MASVSYTHLDVYKRQVYNIFDDFDIMPKVINISKRYII